MREPHSGCFWEQGSTPRPIGEDHSEYRFELDTVDKINISWGCFGESPGINNHFPAISESN